MPANGPGIVRVSPLPPLAPSSIIFRQPRLSPRPALLFATDRFAATFLDRHARRRPFSAFGFSGGFRGFGVEWGRVVLELERFCLFWGLSFYLRLVE